MFLLITYFTFGEGEHVCITKFSIFLHRTRICVGGYVDFRPFVCIGDKGSTWFSFLLFYKKAGANKIVVFWLSIIPSDMLVALYTCIAKLQFMDLCNCIVGEYSVWLIFILIDRSSAPKIPDADHDHWTLKKHILHFLNSFVSVIPSFDFFLTWSHMESTRYLALTSGELFW